MKCLIQLPPINAKSPDVGEPALLELDAAGVGRFDAAGESALVSWTFAALDGGGDC